ncbi:HNH nuclease [Vibrio phage 1.232.O._10N.261.51.E11]|nr:HNH nuclease [Vibrio phage 1.232.O._10N.261.51.E11]
MNINLELIERFHEKWNLNEETQCWVWSAAKAGKGYGQIKIPKARKQVYAHRLSYMIHKGEITEGMEVCHTCDNPSCVRPSHLFLGTSKDNAQDMKSKSRHLNGIKNNQAKLTDDKVRAIHRSAKDGVSQSKIAKANGVGQSTIWKILHGHRWEHIFKEFNT